MSTTFCDDCGSKVYSGGCINCHEELYIMDQYIEQGMELPNENAEFMKRVKEQEIQIQQVQREHPLKQ
jgi:hypothetical protein